MIFGKMCIRRPYVFEKHFSVCNPELATRGIQAFNYIEKETPTLMFSSEFCEVFEKIFFTEYLRTAASNNLLYCNARTLFIQAQVS